MRLYTLPAVWSPLKFVIRYQLNADRDFYVNGNGQLVVFPVLSDDPPIFEPPDPSGPSKRQKLDEVKTLPELIALLKEIL